MGRQPFNFDEELPVPAKVLAKVLGTNGSQIGRMQKAGLLERNRRMLYPLGTNVRLYLRHQSEREQQDESSLREQMLAAQLRHEEAKAELKELELADRRGEYIRRADFAQALGQAFSFIRTQLLALPDATANGLVDRSPRKIAEILEREIRKALRGLVAARFLPREEDQDDDDQEEPEDEDLDEEAPDDGDPDDD